MPSTIVQFLSGYGKDHKGRGLAEIRISPDWKLEREHDYIQWMFPSDIESDFFNGAPVLTDDDIIFIKNSPTIQEQIGLSLARMIEFYEKNDYWITQKNHNFLRLTRILRFLWLAGRKHDYVCLQKVLDDIFGEFPEVIGSETFYFWKNANNREFLLKKKDEKQKRASIPVANKHTDPYSRDL